MHVGIAGEVRCVVTKADGTVRLDTGFQKNLILNQGLDFFGGGKGSNLFARCAIGSGNSAPTSTQTQLDAFIATATGTLYGNKYGYVDDGSGLYKTNVVYKYRFEGLGNINIGEMGLVSNGSTSTNYYLGTRAQAKDGSGLPTTISLNTGETLDIYYKVWQVFSTADTTYTINVLDDIGGSVPYKVICRLAKVGDRDSYIGNTTNAQAIGKPIGRNYTGGADFYYYTGEIQGIAASPLGSYERINSKQLETYVPNSYKAVYGAEASLSEFNANIRSFFLGTTMGIYQIRFGSAVDDSPIVKTAKDTLKIPFEISWGRYEGAL